MTSIEGIIDQGAALERLGGDQELLEELLVVFVEQLPRSMAEIRDAVERGDAQALRLAAHSLKGSAANLSATEVFERARQLETMARENDLAGSRASLAALEAEAGRLQAHLRAAP